jgi:hypothetical protein
MSGACTWGARLREELDGVAHRSCLVQGQGGSNTPILQLPIQLPISNFKLWKPRKALSSRSSSCLGRRRLTILLSDNAKQGRELNVQDMIVLKAPLQLAPAAPLASTLSCHQEITRRGQSYRRGERQQCTGHNRRVNRGAQTGG